MEYANAWVNGNASAANVVKCCNVAVLFPNASDSNLFIPLETRGKIRV